MRLLIAIAFAVLCAGACGGGGGSPASPGPSTNQPVTINIVAERGAQSFSPNPAVAAGRMVVFRNTDTVVHRVRLNDLSLDTGDIAPGATSRPLAMPPQGTNYHCSLHTAMVGGISSGSTGPPPCTGIYC